MKLGNCIVRSLGFRNSGHPWLVHAQRLRRRILRTDQQLRNGYLKVASEPRLHIGGGWHKLEGWLNTDLELVPGVMMLDATERFPFLDDTIRFIYSEHMIEHIPFEKGAFTLSECHRVMKREGVIRVTTPDLTAIAGLHSENLSEVQQEYLAWFCQAFTPDKCSPRSAFAINAMFRLWGHQFIYDEETLAQAMVAAGFHSVKRLRLGESDHPRLRNLENTKRYPDGLLEFESMALEAIK